MDDKITLEQARKTPESPLLESPAVKKSSAENQRKRGSVLNEINLEKLEEELQSCRKSPALKREDFVSRPKSPVLASNFARKYYNSIPESPRSPVRSREVYNTLNEKNFNENPQFVNSPRQQQRFSQNNPRRFNELKKVSSRN